MATTPTTTTPPSTPIIYGPLNIEYLNESWCELQYKSGCSSTGSISHLNHSVNPEVLEKLLQEAQKESQSPVSNGPPLLPSLLPDQTKNSPLLKSFDSFSTMSSVCVVNNNSARDQNITFVNNNNNNNTSSSTTTILNKTRDTTVSSTSSEIISVVPMSDMSSVVYSQTSAKLKMRIVGGNENINIAKPMTSSSSMFMPIRRESSEASVCTSRMFVYDDDEDDEIFCQDDEEDDDDVDLEYVEDEEDEECNRINSNNLNNNTLTDQAASQLIHTEMKSRQRNKKRKHHETCKHCNKHRQEINSLLEKQISQEKELIRLRNEYEIKLLNKSLELSTHSSKSSSSTSNNRPNSSTNQTKMINVTSSPSGPLSPPSFSSASSTTGGGQASPIYPPPSYSQSHQEVGNNSGGGGGNTAVISTKDWMKYFASRPQSLPPKEWNLVHPNSQQATTTATTSRCLVAQQTKLVVGSSRVSDNLANMTSRNENKMTSGENCGGSSVDEHCSSLKLLGSESVSISKLIFTHVASFIVGATLMFLVLRKHLNFRGSIYFI